MHRVDFVALALGCGAALVFDILFECSRWESFLIVVVVSLVVRVSADLVTWLSGRGAHGPSQ